MLALKQFDAYLFGAHRLVRAVLPAMREQRAGRLIFMSSSAAAALRLPDRPIEAYRSASTPVIERFRRSQLTGPEPEAFAATIVRAIEARSLRSSYRVGPMSKSLPIMRAVLPDRVFRALFARHFGLRRSR